MTTFFPQCASSLGHAVAWVFYPAASILSLIFQDMNPLGIRVSGVVGALVWFALLAWWCSRQQHGQWSWRFTLILAFGAMGVVPYLWVMSRPEQFMLLPLLVFCVAALHGPEKEKWVQRTLLLMLMVVLLSVFFYVHPKSIFFTPFFLVVVWVGTRNFSVWVRGGLLIYTFVLAVQALADANTLSACQDAPVVREVLGSNVVNPGLLFENPYLFFRGLIKNLVYFFPNMGQHLIFSPTFQSGWLPPLEGSPSWLMLLNAVVWGAVCLFIALSHAAALIGLLFAIYRRSVTSPLLLAALLAAADVLNAMLYNGQNFYAAIQYVPIAMMISVLLFNESQGKAIASWLPAWESKAALMAAGLASLSLIALMSLVTPSLLRSADLQRAEIWGQPLSVPVFNTEAHMNAIREVGRMCHIPERSASFVVVDHMTYFVYRKNVRPVHVHYVSERAYGGDLLGKLIPFLKAHGSPGVVSRCDWIPGEMRGIEKVGEMGYCCVDLTE
ncbi:hypothetical protein EJA05_07570 [Pseudomonas oryziphila]|uniref:Glycosyltransferase RgtA/B/C/D-like domain-containing protein n=1 Tax=Pseudomonas entomophila TaxID=312306 RepID=A0A3Q8U4I4_9PSED|nr:hypothetical protein EJA05_07570 [Pseudomonas oryziphila]